MTQTLTPGGCCLLPVQSKLLSPLPLSLFLAFKALTDKAVLLFIVWFAGAVTLVTVLLAIWRSNQYANAL